jgi:ligand-binding SRPBCC domain-containing protein
VVEGVVERYRGAKVTSLRVSDVFEADPAEVWKVLADPRNLPRWNSHIHEVLDAPDGLLEAGDTYGVELRVMGVPARIRATVAELQRERYSEVLLTGPLEATVRTYLRQAGPGRTRVEHEVEYRFRGGPLGRVLAGAVRRLGASMILRRGLRAQRDQVERG